jgi:hypothetical protein
VDSAAYEDAEQAAVSDFMDKDNSASLPKAQLTTLRWLIFAGGLVAIFTVLIVSAYLHSALEQKTA